MKFSRDAAIPRIPAPHLLKQGQLQLAGASFRDQCQLKVDPNKPQVVGDVFWATKGTKRRRPARRRCPRPPVGASRPALLGNRVAAGRAAAAARAAPTPGAKATAKLERKSPRPPELSLTHQVAGTLASQVDLGACFDPPSSLPCLQTQMEHCMTMTTWCGNPKRICQKLTQTRPTSSGTHAIKPLQPGNDHE